MASVTEPNEQDGGTEQNALIDEYDKMSARGLVETMAGTGDPFDQMSMRSLLEWLARNGGGGGGTGTETDPVWAAQKGTYATKSYVDAEVHNLDLIQQAILEMISATDSKISTIDEQVQDMQASPVLVNPQVFTYGADTYPFVLSSAPKVVLEILVLNGDTEFHYLQDGDYNISGTSLTVTVPTLSDGMKVKIAYAR